MRCPYCKTAVEATCAACPRCALAFDKVTRLFGIVPRIVEGISDDAGILSNAAKRRIQAAAADLSIRFPQASFNLVTAKVPKNSSLGVFAFWIFNSAGIARGIDRGSNNHDILLVLDPTSGRANLTVGYGLESFVSEAELAEIISAAQPAFEAGKFAAGVVKIITHLREALTDIAANLETTHGLTPIVRAKPRHAEVAPTEF